jgi:hypothetical protein
VGEDTGQTAGAAVCRAGADSAPPLRLPAEENVIEAPLLHDLAGRPIAGPGCMRHCLWRQFRVNANAADCNPTGDCFSDC